MPIAMLYLLYHMIACTMNNSISRFDAQSRCRGYIYLDLLVTHVRCGIRTVVRRFSVVAGASVGLGVCSVVKTRPCGGS